VLNALGYIGFKVVTTSGDRNEYMWTVRKRVAEKLLRVGLTKVGLFSPFFLFFAAGTESGHGHPIPGNRAILQPVATD